MPKSIKSKDFSLLEQYIYNNVIKTHPTKKTAQQYASSIGWPQKNVIQVKRRFEWVWIVAQVMQPDTINGITVDVLKCPLGQYEVDFGVQRMLTVDVRRAV